MSLPWRPRVEFISDGERADASVTNRPIRQLAEQTQHLKQVLSNSSPDSGRHIYRGAPLDESVEVLDFVYWDGEAGAHKPAIAEVTEENGTSLIGPRSLAVGFVVSKNSATEGDILIDGRINLAAEGIDPSAMLENSFTEAFSPGRYFLSNKVPGKMTRSLRTPNIQVGVFSETESLVQVVFKDVYESHLHYRFPLQAQPAASQNYARTGWSVIDGTNKSVDYYNQGSTATPPPIILCIRPAAITGVEVPTRVEIYNETGQMRVALVQDSVTIQDPFSGDNTTSQPLVAWPAYGDWYAIPDTNLEVSFTRVDNTYSQTLQADAATYLNTTNKRFKIFLPDDLVGWANANALDELSTPTGVLYRYLLESDSELSSAFPPVPLESGIIEVNGVSYATPTDFKITQSGVFWSVGVAQGNFSPWPSDYTLAAPMDTANGRNIVLHFTKSGISNAQSVVLSLQATPPVYITKCPSGDPASAGHLQVGVDLSLAINDEATVYSSTALVNVEGQKFQLGYVVSELEEGPGIQIERLDTVAGNKNVGKLRISRKDLKFEGIMYTLALRNAKQNWGANGIESHISFLPASQAACGVTGLMRLPSADLDTNNFKLKVLAAFHGSVPVLAGAAEQSALFKVTYHVLRPGFDTAAMTELNALEVQIWKISFPAGYTAGRLLSTEYPYSAEDADLFQIDNNTLIARPNSLVAQSGGFAAGDIVSVAIDRIESDGNGNVDGYPGNVGMLGLHWILP